MTVMLALFVIMLSLLFLLDSRLGAVRRVVGPTWRTYTIVQLAMVAATVVSLERVLGAIEHRYVFGVMIGLEMLALIWAGMLARQQDKQKAQ